ncbi:glycosyltransferase family 4 protein [Telluria aromaticivorans]|uniref:Glycosyltransferase family 4 protein n=1 Tax=Telluria aromaticivorans TaxID=2725995 RepID=A0A7Y2JWR9_9BURK|nr:glycosyltransferase family 4 protein [Telluria aromaticivorans]NNG21843.1 glycosyltransferase family 4 protein [Telluria aromaticivorans]
MKVCFVGMDNLPVLAEEFNAHGIGGEQVQQTLLAKALARRGFEVSMVVYDYGQPDQAEWDGITTHRSFRQAAGLPLLRFVYPRWVKTWDALRKADADVYYLSCAGMHLGLVSLFCSRYHRKLIFRVAHDSDCTPDALLIKYWRDKKLYEYGLRHAHRILVQTQRQHAAMLANYRRGSTVARMLVQSSEKPVERTVDVLWVNNVRQFKRPDLLLALARRMPDLRFRMIGGEQPGSESLYASIAADAARIQNLDFLGRVPYHQMAQHYAGARVFVNTSDSEGFPNSYLQAWIHGTPAVAFFDPDDVIRRERLGHAAGSMDEMEQRVRELVSDHSQWRQCSERCRDFMDRHYAEQDVIAPYLQGIQEVCHG